MGLDVYGYATFEVVEPTTEAEREEAYWVWEHPEWPGRAVGLPLGGYVVDPEMCDAAFSLTYGRYNHFRAALSWAALEVEPVTVWSTRGARWAGAPFVELIDFSDCEGIIGPVVASKLAADFQAHRETIMARVRFYTKLSVRLEHFERWYDELAACFRVAAGSGFVVFG